MPWQIQEAKQRFSQLLRRALEDGPQVVTRHGEEVAVVLSLEDYRRLGGSDFKAFLLDAPDLGALDLYRSDEPAEIVEL